MINSPRSLAYLGIEVEMGLTVGRTQKGHRIEDGV